MKSCVLHIGTNKGDRPSFLRKAKDLIGDKIGHIIKSSKVYETAPWGITDQSEFLNQAIRVTTTLSPFEILDNISWIEVKLGRTKTMKWGPREIDIDIIFYEDLILYSCSLEIPHPHYSKRQFVLVPLMDLNPNIIDPLRRKRLSEIAKECTDNSHIAEYIGA